MAEEGVKTFHIQHYLSPEDHGERFEGLSLVVSEGSSGKWYPLLDSIIGFDHHVGHTYELKVRVTPIPEDEIEEDGPTNIYELVEMVKDTEVPKGTEFKIKIPVSPATTWLEPLEDQPGYYSLYSPSYQIYAKSKELRQVIDTKLSKEQEIILTLQVPAEAEEPFSVVAVN
eukprot:TRINITY_DN2541_c0_g1_i1.p1 TRINITY_DN2541_c0_g1~~TRINITY_DN2541_c0_g1_i1.p1  ORF type:complete len:171 (+),score=32.30 TRINITY_DN2541_c0_g1_i1:75-587(+)